MIFNPTVQGGKQEAPVISVSSSGLITATAGDQSATQQLPTQAARTITPSTSTQTAVASGRYTTGNVTVAGSANLVPENIKSGVNIFGVTGTFEGESSEIMKEVDWAGFSEALSNPQPPVFTTGLIFLQNSGLYNGGIPFVLRGDYISRGTTPNYLITPAGQSFITPNGSSSYFYVDFDGEVVMNYDDISYAETPPTFASGWSARYFILEL